MQHSEWMAAPQIHPNKSEMYCNSFASFSSNEGRISNKSARTKDRFFFYHANIIFTKVSTFDKLEQCGQSSNL